MVGCSFGLQERRLTSPGRIVDELLALDVALQPCRRPLVRPRRFTVVHRRQQCPNRASPCSRIISTLLLRFWKVEGRCWQLGDRAWTSNYARLRSVHRR